MAVCLVKRIANVNSLGVKVMGWLEAVGEERVVRTKTGDALVFLGVSKKGRGERKKGFTTHVRVKPFID